MPEYVEMADLTNDHLLCKYPGIRHAWDENPGAELPSGPNSYYATFVLCVRCTRCGREKFEYLDRNRRRMGVPYYRNPDDYQHTHRMYGDDMRRELVSRDLLVTRLKTSSNGKRKR